MRHSGTVSRHQVPFALRCGLTVLLHGQREVRCHEACAGARQVLPLAVCPRGENSRFPEVAGGYQRFHCSARKRNYLEVWKLLISSLRNF